MKLLHYRSVTLNRYAPLRCKPPSFFEGTKTIVIRGVVHEVRLELTSPMRAPDP